MHASCTICGDVFTGLDPEIIRTTLCGHIFHHSCLTEWLQRSKTCPQCRSKVDERSMIKLYFQLSSYTVQDSGSLENMVQSLKFQLKMKDIECTKLTEETNKAKAQAKGLRDKVLQAEENIRSHQTVVSSLQERIKVLKVQVKSYSEEKLKNEELQHQLHKYSNIEKILKGSSTEAAEAVELMKNLKDPTGLCACIVSLKKEVYNYKEKARDAQNHLKVNEIKLSSALSEVKKLGEQMSISNRSLTKLKEDIAYTENENESLKKKCKNLKEALLSPSTGTNSSNPRDKALRRFINEYPTPVLKESPPIEISIPTSSRVNTGRETSPPSPVRLGSLHDKKRLLNKRRLVPGSASSSATPCYDGLGGHKKDDVTLTDKATLFRAVERSKTNKIVLNNKRFKPNSKMEASKSSLLNFYPKKN